MSNALAAVYEGPEKIIIKEVPLPQIGDDDMLIRIDVAGIDGSEVKMYLGQMDFFNAVAPVIIGDELVGTVLEIGKKAEETRQLKVGDRVTVESTFPCGQCKHCMTGNYYLCDGGIADKYLGFFKLKDGYGLRGAYATHMFVPKERLVYKIPSDMSLDAAIMSVSVFANGLRWMSGCDLQLNQSVLILGPGPQGLMCSLAARMSGAGKIIMVGLEKDKERLEMSKKFGTDVTLYFEDPLLEEKIKQETNNNLPDIVLDSSGSIEASKFALKIVGKGGKVTIVGFSGDLLPVNLGLLMMREISLVGFLSHPYFVDKAIDLGYRLYKSGQFPIGELVTHKYGIHDADLALRVAGNKVPGEHPSKTVLYPWMNLGDEI